MTSLTHATIIPLIGGEVIGSEQAHGKPPEFILTYSPFEANERHLRSWYKDRGVDMPYIVVDQGGKPMKKVDVISSVCPCAGLSFLSTGYGDHNENNKWMIETAKYVLGEVKPRVFWGENSPNLAGHVGRNIRAQLRQIGLDNGYSMSLYVTKSLLHGIPQVRKRAFYFFWQGDKVPVLDWYDRGYQRIEDLLTGVKSNTLMEPINKNTPSMDDVYYRYVLDVIHDGMTHREFASRFGTSSVRDNDILSYIEAKGVSYRTVGKWLRETGLGKDKDQEKCERRATKLEAGGNVMRRGTIVPKDRIGAFVGHYPMMLTHPVEDRYITYREGLSIMGMPEDFELLDPRKSVNHMCQNVPVNTARDMASEVAMAIEDKRQWISGESLMTQDNTTRTFRDQPNQETSATLESFFQEA